MNRLAPMTNSFFSAHRFTVTGLSVGAGAFEEAVSSAYYGAHHAARALLFSLGLEVRSHKALRSLLSRHFVRAGVIPRDTSRRLAELFDARHKADYGVRTRFSREQAEAWVLLVEHVRRGGRRPLGAPPCALRPLLRPRKTRPLPPHPAVPSWAWSLP